MRIAVVEKGEQRVAVGVDIEAVVLGRAHPEIGEANSARDPLRHAARVEALHENVVAERGIPVRVIVEPADVATTVRSRPDLRLDLLVGFDRDAEVHHRIGTPLRERAGRRDEAESSERKSDDCCFS